MAFIDYYKILGVARDIPQKDVRKAYLKRAKLFHPDLHPDDPKAKAKFQALTEAFDVINDPEKRRKYDQYGEQCAMLRPTNEPAAEPVALIIGAVVVAKAPSKALISADSVVAVVASPISSATCLVRPGGAEHLNGVAECVRVK